MPSQENESPTLTRLRIPGLDGVRGFAIISVFIYHFFAGWNHWQGIGSIALGHLLRAGYLGVDLFFVLSGYLITGVLLKSRDGQHRWRNFFARRTLRIFPAYYVVLLLSFTLVPWLDARLATPQGPLPKELVHNWPWFVSYLSNYHLTYQHGYPVGLSLTWTLSVEEQFYLVWPWLIWFVPTHLLMRAFIGVVLVSTASKVGCYFMDYPDDSLRYFTSNCMDRFAVGGALAFATQKKELSKSIGTTIVRGGLWLFAPILVVSATFRDKPDILTGLLIRDFASAWVSASLIVVATHSQNHPLKKLFEWRPLCGVGKYSYGLYLVHAPIIGWWQASEVPSPLSLALVVDYAWRFTGASLASLLVAYLLYRAVEQPLLGLASRFRS